MASLAILLVKHLEKWFFSWISASLSVYYFTQVLKYLVYIVKCIVVSFVAIFKIWIFYLNISDNLMRVFSGYYEDTVELFLSH